MACTYDIDQSGLLSPSQTQGPNILSRLQQLKNWLASRGLHAEEIDVLRRKHDQRIQDTENEYQFLTNVQTIVNQTLKRSDYPQRKHPFATKNDLNQIRTSVASRTSKENAQLRKQSRASSYACLVDGLQVLPEDKIMPFLNFINNDTANDRLRFIGEVLPFLISSLLANTKSADERETQPLEKEKPKPKEMVVDRAISPPEHAELLPLPQHRKRPRTIENEDGGHEATKSPSSPPPPRRRSERIKRLVDEGQNRNMPSHRGRKRRKLS
jgi:hypothetical protein